MNARAPRDPRYRRGTAARKAAHDRAELTTMAQSLGEPTPIAAWDWRYLAEKVRQAWCGSVSLWPPPGST